MSGTRYAILILRLAASVIFISALPQKSFSQDTTSYFFSKQISIRELRSAIDVLAADSLEGRETGKPGQKKAAAFISKKFESLGLIPKGPKGYLQHTAMSIRSNGGRNFEVNQKLFLFMKDYFYLGAPKDTAIILDTIVFAGYGIDDAAYDDYDRLNAAGRAVLILSGEPRNRNGKYLITGSRQGSVWSTDLQKKIDAAEKKHASMLLIISDSLQQTIDSLSYVSSAPYRAMIPVIFVSREIGESLMTEINAGMIARSETKLNKKGKPAGFVSPSSATLPLLRNIDALRGENVAGLLEGSDKKDEVLVITAHYDHLGKKDSAIYHGADDNASGTSAVIELARIFTQAAKAGFRPRRSILFMTVSGEEKGLLGSRYYVKHPLIPLESTMTNLNIDMIGRIDPRHDSTKTDKYIYVIGSDKLSTTLHSINEAMNAKYTLLELDYTYNRPDDPNRYYYRSDHYNFAKHNIPVIFYFSGTHADYHQPGDTPDKIRYDLVVKRAQLVFLTAWELANRDDSITVDVQKEKQKPDEEQ